MYMGDRDSIRAKWLAIAKAVELDSFNNWFEFKYYLVDLAYKIAPMLGMDEDDLIRRLDGETIPDIVIKFDSALEGVESNDSVMALLSYELNTADKTEFDYYAEGRSIFREIIKASLG